MKKIIMAALLFISLGAQAVEIQREVVGYGSNRSDAMNNAISEAVRQQFGVTVSSDTISKMVAKETGDSFEFSESSDTGSKQQFSGRVSSYDIIDVVCASNECEARLNVKFEVSQRDLNKKKDQSVLDNRKTLFIDVSGKYAKEFKAHLESRFVQARKFAVMQQQKGADYVLTVNVEQATTHASKKTKTVELTGESSTKYSKASVVRVKYKVLKTSTKQIVAANSQRTSSATHHVSTLLDKWASEKLFKEVHSHIFPVRVVKVDGTKIIIGEGGKSVAVGDRFDVYRAGESVIDPYTGESLGSDETYIGIVKITTVHAKKSYGKLVKGSSVERLDILRKKATVAKSTRPTKKAVEEKKTVGIIL